MKRVCNIVLLLIVLLSLALTTLSCRLGCKYDIPYGIWKSDDPDITLYIISKSFTVSTGTYNRDGDVREVLIMFHHVPMFSIKDFNAQYINDSGQWVRKGDHFYFVGGFKLKRKGNLYYYVNVSSDGFGGQKSYEKQTIIFELIEEYKPSTSKQFKAARCTVRDPRSNRIYGKVKIGNTWWMLQNIDYETGNSLCYDDDRSNCRRYGRLYDWNAAMEACPEGWRLPTREDWDDLVQVVRGRKSPDVGKRLKLRSGWNNNGNGTDDYGFSALPGGYRVVDGTFNHVGHRGFWWTATEAGDAAYYRSASSDNNDLGEGLGHKSLGFSVRCVRNEPDTPPSEWQAPPLQWRAPPRR